MALAGQSPASRPAAPASAPSSLSQHLSELLRQGKLEEAVRTVQDAYRSRPADAAIRAEFVQLHMALAERLLRDERFADAERTAATALSVEPSHAAARRLIDAVATARREAPARVEEARRLIRLEWFESAYDTLRQASALLPERRLEWADDLLTAAEGAGDDHYFCKNFAQAFHYYDAVKHAGRPAADTLKQRWLQSMVFALADDIEGRDYPIEYWHKTVTTAEAFVGHRGDPLLALLRGLANEDLNDPRRAAENYAEASGQRFAARNADALRRARNAALNVVRRRYAESLSPRRNGAWRAHGSGDWSVIDGPRFRIRHRSPAAAQRVGEALDFHFDRVCRYLGRTLQSLPWEQRCDVTLHANLDALRREAGLGDMVRAISAIRTADGRLVAHSIQVAQDDPLLLAATLPHELAHLVLAAVVSYRPTSAVLSEGLALHCEPRCRAIQFQRVLGESGGLRPTVELFAQTQVHPGSDRRFYGEAFGLTEFALARIAPAELVGVAADNAPADALADKLGFAKASELDAALAGDR